MTSDILPRSGLHYSPMFDYEVRLVSHLTHPLAAKTPKYTENIASETLLDPVQVVDWMSGGIFFSRQASAVKASITPYC